MQSDPVRYVPCHYTGLSTPCLCIAFSHSNAPIEDYKDRLYTIKTPAEQIDEWLNTIELKGFEALDLIRKIMERIR